MPNHVINELVFRGVSQDQVASIIDATCRDGLVNFEVLLPMPLNVWRASIGAVEEKAFGQTWYEWSTANWGTKWNAYSHKETQIGPDNLTLCFETAWRPPYPWLCAVWNHLKLPFEHNWLDEGAERARSGVFQLDESPMGRDWKEDDATDEAHRRLHKLHWGIETFEDEAEKNDAE
jgi:hypothetical protein